MLVLIMFAVTIVIGIALLLFFRINDNYALMVPGVVLLIVGVGAVIIASGFAIGVSVSKEKDYQNTLYEKQVLEYRLDHIEDDLVGNEVLYQEIVDFNNKLRECKFYCDSPWIGLFYNDKIATIDYIEMPIGVGNDGQRIYQLFDKNAFEQRA